MRGYEVRVAARDDLPGVGELLGEYVSRELSSRWLGCVEQVERDGFGRHFELLLACRRGGEIAGFAAFAPDYDLHVCVRGGRVIDLYVRPGHRGRGLAPALLARAAAEIRRAGGHYMKGHALRRPGTLRLYERCGVPFHGPEYSIGARAFRQLASLAGADARRLAAGLPEKSWNFSE